MGSVGGIRLAFSVNKLEHKNNDCFRYTQYIDQYSCTSRKRSCRFGQVSHSIRSVWPAEKIAWSVFITAFDWRLSIPFQQVLRIVIELRDIFFSTEIRHNYVSILSVSRWQETRLVSFSYHYTII